MTLIDPNTKPKSIESGLKFAKKRGVDMVVHSSYSFERAKKIERFCKRRDPPVELVAGVEFKLPSKRDIKEGRPHRYHFLVIGLKEPLNSNSLEDALDKANEQGAAVCVTHPCSPFDGWERNTVEKHSGRIHGIEIKNGMMQGLPYSNWLAEKNFGQMNKTKLYSSYAHLAENVGKCATRFEENIETEDDLVDIIKGNPKTSFEGPNGPRTFISGLKELKTEYSRANKLYLANQLFRKYF